MTKIFTLVKNIVMMKPFRSNSDCQGKRGFWANLIDDNTTVNVMSFFLLASIFITLVLLIIPAFGLMLDIIDHRTITMDLSGLSSYILAVAGIFASAGISSAWSSYSSNKLMDKDEKEIRLKQMQKQLEENSYVKETHEFDNDCECQDEY